MGIIKKEHYIVYYSVCPCYFPPWAIPSRIIPPWLFSPTGCVVTALFWFVASFARVRIEDSSGNRFVSTAYFTKPGFVGRECSGGKQPGWNLQEGIFREGICQSPKTSCVDYPLLPSFDIPLKPYYQCIKGNEKSAPNNKFTIHWML